MDRIYSFAIVSVCLILSQVLSADAEERNLRSVLIVYTVGQPSAEFPGDLDAITTATPIVNNTQTIADDLARELESREILVKTINASEIKSHEIIFDYTVLVLGTPVRYIHVSWEMKKFIDEIMWRIAHLASNQFQTKRVFAYAVAGGSGTPALDFLQQIMSFLNNSLKARTQFLGSYTQKRVDEEIKLFADKIEAALPRLPAAVTDYEMHEN